MNFCALNREPETCVSTADEIEASLVMDCVSRFFMHRIFLLFLFYNPLCFLADSYILMSETNKYGSRLISVSS